MSNTNYLAHFGRKGQQHGLRRYQSYETAPTRSGMVGQEVGEAAKQADRLERRDEDHNGPRRGPVKYEAKPSYNSPSDLAKASKKQSLKDKLRAKKAEKDAQDIEKNKAKWAKSYKDLEKHKDAFTNRELEYALNRLNLTDRIKSDRWEQTRNLTQKGADTMRNLANASKSFVDIYNVVAGGYNTYQNYKTNKANKYDFMPKWNSSSGSYNFNNNNQNNQQNQHKPSTINTRRGRFRGHADHSGMSATEYIAHFGIPGQKKGIRNFQSYKTAPTRSGMVGEERGLAAKQAERLGEEVDTDEVFKKEISEYKDLVNKKIIQTEHDVGYRDNMSKEHRKAVDLGMNALDRMGEYDIGYEKHYRDETEDNKKFLRDWFVFEDQTIGMFTIANMIQKGATKQQVNRIIDTAEEAYDSKFNEETGHYESKHGEEYEMIPGVFQLAEGNWDDRLRSFARACFKELESEKP